MQQDKLRTNLTLSWQLTYRMLEMTTHAPTNTVMEKHGTSNIKCHRKHHFRLSDLWVVDINNEACQVKNKHNTIMTTYLCGELADQEEASGDFLPVFCLHLLLLSRAGVHTTTWLQGRRLPLTSVVIPLITILNNRLLFYNWAVANRRIHVTMCGLI